MLMAATTTEVADEVILTAARHAAHRLARMYGEKDVEDVISRALVWAYEHMDQVERLIARTRATASRRDGDTAGLEVTFLADRLFQRIQKQHEGHARKALPVADKVEAGTVALESDALRSAVRTALASLPEHYRQVIEATVLGGQSLTEAADVAGVAKQVMARRCSRARAALAEALYGDEVHGADLRALIAEDMSALADRAGDRPPKRRPSGAVDLDAIDTDDMPEPYAETQRVMEATDKAYHRGVRRAGRFVDLGYRDALGHDAALGYGDTAYRVGERLALDVYPTTGRPYMAASNWGRWVPMNQREEGE